MTTSPALQLTAPVSMTVHPDASGYARGTFQITNTGSQPLSVHESLGRVTPATLHYPAASGATLTQLGSPWLSVTPAKFILAPHTAETVTITSRVPAGTQGSHYLNVIWTASPVHVSAGPLHLSGAVATTVGIPLPGVAVPVAAGHSLPHAVAAPHHGGIGTMDLAGIGLAAALVASVTGLVIRRRRRNRRAQVQA